MAYKCKLSYYIVKMLRTPEVLQEGRKAIARFHSDAHETLRSSAPRWYRRTFDQRLRTLNARELRRWLDDPAYDPIFQARHLHSANWSWW